MANVVTRGALAFHTKTQVDAVRDAFVAQSGGALVNGRLIGHSNNGSSFQFEVGGQARTPEEVVEIIKDAYLQLGYAEYGDVTLPQTAGRFT